MRNKCEILRSICFTREDMETITNLGDQFSKEEIEFMVEFKKIYELGLGQLEKFINKLDEEGKDLDEYTIQYYVNLLLNGPLATHVKKLSEDKKYFSKIPNIMGFFGNKEKISQNTTSLEEYPLPLGATVDTYNKLPPFIQKNIKIGNDINEKLFRSSVKHSTVFDNTLPIVDKAPQQRYSEEPTGEWVKKAHGTCLVKDSLFYTVLNKINSDVFDKLKEFLGEEDFRIWADRKTYNPFSDVNDSTSSNFKILKKFKEGDREIELPLDLMGEVFDSVKKREATLKIVNPNKDKEYQLGTVEGQLGI
jgi:hypothetical protein